MSFKVNDRVVIKEVKKEFGRTDDLVERLERIKEDGEVGTVISVDSADCKLDMYVSFKMGGNVWLSSSELEDFTETQVIASVEELERLLNFGEDVEEEYMSVFEEDGEDYDSKLKLLDYIIERYYGGFVCNLEEEYIADKITEKVLDNISCAIMMEEEVLKNVATEIILATMRTLNMSIDEMERRLNS